VPWLPIYMHILHIEAIELPMKIIVLSIKLEQWVREKQVELVSMRTNLSWFGGTDIRSWNKNSVSLIILVLVY